jgi:hypothetical protein
MQSFEDKAFLRRVLCYDPRGAYIWLNVYDMTPGRGGIYGPKCTCNVYIHMQYGEPSDKGASCASVNSYIEEIMQSLLTCEL